MIPPSLMYQMAQARQAELLRETEEYRRAGLTVRMRIRARIAGFPTGSRRSRAGVVGPSKPGLGEDQPPEEGARLRKEPRSPIDSVGAREHARSARYRA
jgi:hypothetical protein